VDVELKVLDSELRQRDYQAVFDDLAKHALANKIQIWNLNVDRLSLLVIAGEATLAQRAKYSRPLGGATDSWSRDAIKSARFLSQFSAAEQNYTSWQIGSCFPGARWMKYAPQPFDIDFPISDGDDYGAIATETASKRI
jgi:hypothetical protein